MNDPPTTVEQCLSEEELIATPSRSAVLQKGSDSSQPPQGRTPLQAIFDDQDQVRDTQRSPVPIAFVSSDRRSPIPPRVHPRRCDVCLAQNKASNRVLEYVGQKRDAFLALSLNRVIQENDLSPQTVFRPFEEGTRRAATDPAGSRNPRMCRHCERQLNIICFPKKKQRSKVESFKRYIWNRLCSNKQERNDKSLEARDTVLSKKCYLHGHLSSETSCLNPTTSLSSPIYLQPRMSEAWKIEKWIQDFSKQMVIGTAVAKEIVKNADNIKLCSRHYSAMRNVMMVIEANEKACSICGPTGDKRYAGEVTKFPIESLNENEDILCVVEDCLSVLTDNRLQPRDVKFVCPPCRLVTLSRVSMKTMDLRLNVPLYRGEFDYGPTPSLVLKCIQYVRDQLRTKNRMFVKLKEVHELYLELVKSSWSSGIKKLAHSDIRTLRKYIQPPLAQTKIHLELGAKKVGSFFCTLITFRKIALEQTKPTAMDYQKSPEDEKKYVKILEDFLRSKQKEIEDGNWDMVDYIRAVPKGLWIFDVSVYISQSLADRCSAVSKLCNVKMEEEWPYDPRECPTNMHAMPRHEFAFALAMYFSMERRVYLKTKGKVRGPIFTSLSITALTDATVGFMSLMNRVGCLTSYQAIDSIRSNAIAQRVQNGPFGDVKLTAFQTYSMDNFNVRTSNTLAIHGKSAYGFDGTATQRVEPNTHFDLRLCVRGERQRTFYRRDLRA